MCSLVGGILNEIAHFRRKVRLQSRPTLADMTTSSIGIQRILPRRGPGWQGANPSPRRSDEADRDRTPESDTERSPPEPGTGHIVDRDA